MEKEDIKIKELIREGLLKEAPAGFTENVMKTITSEQDQKISQNDFSGYGYAAIILAAISLSAGVSYYLDSSILKSTFGFIPRYFNKIVYVLSGAFSGPINIEISSGIFSFGMGLILVMVSLLIFDNLLSRRDKSFKLLV